MHLSEHKYAGFLAYDKQNTISIKLKKKTVTCQPVSSVVNLLLLKTSEVRKRLSSLSLVTSKLLLPCPAIM